MSDVSGKSVLDLLWEQLDMFVDRYQELAEDFSQTDAAVSEERGKAHGAACQLAMVINPYAPDVAAVKAEALARWEQRHDVPPPAEPHGTPISERGLARRARRQARRAARNG